MKSYLKLEDIRAYSMSFELANAVWELVSHWDSFNKFSIGQQFIQSVDSISANIAEGFGRYHKKDKIKFYYNARGSVFESLDWLRKSKARSLVDNSKYEFFLERLGLLPIEINSLIKYTNERLTI